MPVSSTADFCKTSLAPFRDSENTHGEFYGAQQHRIMGHITQEHYREAADCIKVQYVFAACSVTLVKLELAASELSNRPMTNTLIPVGKLQLSNVSHHATAARSTASFFSYLDFKQRAFGEQRGDTTLHIPTHQSKNWPRHFGADHPLGCIALLSASYAQPRNRITAQAPASTICTPNYGLLPQIYCVAIRTCRMICKAASTYIRLWHASAAIFGLDIGYS